MRKAPGIRGPLKLPKYKRFTYEPRYYNPDKEFIEERLQAHEVDYEKDSENEEDREEKVLNRTLTYGSFTARRPQLGDDLPGAKRRSYEALGKPFLFITSLASTFGYFYYEGFENYAIGLFLTGFLIYGRLKFKGIF